MNIRSIDLKEFYETTRGRVVQRILRQRLREMWPVTDGMRILGIGYALPYLRHPASEIQQAFALMPREQGALYWPAELAGRVALCDEDHFPIESSTIDRLLVIHTTQTFEGLDRVLEESWRVLAGQGRIILIMPNRQGLWARFDHTPFGQGTPYSMGQIRSLLKQHMFVPERYEHALFFPPASSRLMLSMAPIIEKIGRRFFDVFGGVNIVEASKQIYAGIPAASAVSRTGRVPRFKVRPVSAPRQRV